MKLQKRYQVRIELGFGYNTKQIGRKLVTYNKARKIASWLKKRGLDAYIAPMEIYV